MLKVVNRQVDRMQDMNKLAKGFNKWRRFTVNIVTELPKMTIYKLQNRQYENKLRLVVLKEDVTEKDECFSEFTE